jgi:hypothetical protein
VLTNLDKGNVMSAAMDRVKYSPLVASAYNRWLILRNRGVEAYVFVATTGRSGSQSLAQIFAAAERAACFHEPYPMMLAEDGGRSGGGELTRTFRSKKRINIRRQAGGSRYYLETNHQFIKRFAEEAVREFGSRLRVIHLRRRPAQVAASFCSIGSVPGKTSNGSLYLLDPEAADNLIDARALLASHEYSADIFRCLWYWYEIESRTRRFLERNPTVVSSTLQTGDLNLEGPLIRMFEELGIAYSPESLSALTGERVNQKKALKKAAIDLDEVEEQNRVFRAELEQRYGARFWTRDATDF